MVIWGDWPDTELLCVATFCSLMALLPLPSQCACIKRACDRGTHYALLVHQTITAFIIHWQTMSSNQIKITFRKNPSFDPKQCKQWLPAHCECKQLFWKQTKKHVLLGNTFRRKTPIFINADKVPSLGLRRCSFSSVKTCVYYFFSSYFHHECKLQQPQTCNHLPCSQEQSLSSLLQSLTKPDCELGWYRHRAASSPDAQSCWGAEKARTAQVSLYLTLRKSLIGKHSHYKGIRLMYCSFCCSKLNSAY